MKHILGTALLAASLAVGGALAASPAAASGEQSHRSAVQHEQAKPLTDVSAQRRHRRHRHYHRHRHYRPYYYAPRYYRPYYYRPYYYAPRPYFGFGFGFGPRYYW